MTRRDKNATALVRDLLAWYSAHKRPLPWRDAPAPYRVWVGEVMSQQTTLKVAVPRFEIFVARLPDAAALAACPEDVLRRLWAGLGYYARARNLQKGARYVTDDLAGALPGTCAGWLDVPGCGPYTAAMVASMCFGERVPAVDGNVVRVASRLLGMAEGVWTKDGQARIREFAAERVRLSDAPGDFNQALMELGATVCRKARPACGSCPIASACRAREDGAADRIPQPRPRKAGVDTRVVCVVLLARGRVALARRERGFLSGTVGFPVVTEGSREARDLLDILGRIPGARIRAAQGAFRHTITHHRIHGSILVALLPARGSPRVVEAELGRALGVSDFSWSNRAGVRDALGAALDRKALDLLEAP
ncbi:MAG: A/G-specific adenine glycosylase [Deltaproteobacteria bacterium]|nr:A/G-specific adenine glycosylase [Deltaproteobacteria bacterium]